MRSAVSKAAAASEQAKARAQQKRCIQVDASNHFIPAAVWLKLVDQLLLLPPYYAAATATAGGGSPAAARAVSVGAVAAEGLSMMRIDSGTSGRGQQGEGGGEMDGFRQWLAWGVLCGAEAVLSDDPKHLEQLMERLVLLSNMEMIGGGTTAATAGSGAGLRHGGLSGVGGASLLFDGEGGGGVSSAGEEWEDSVAPLAMRDLQKRLSPGGKVALWMAQGCSTMTGTAAAPVAAENDGVGGDGCWDPLDDVFRVLCPWAR